MSSDENYDEVDSDREEYQEYREPGEAGRAREPAEDELARGTAAGDDEMVYAGGREGDDSWLGTGLGVTLVVVGLVLFLFPEPATSLTGILLMVTGLVVWAAAAMR